MSPKAPVKVPEKVPKYFFIFIGISEYWPGNALVSKNRKGHQLRKLRGAITDVKKFQEYIRGQPRLENSEVFMLTSPPLLASEPKGSDWPTYENIVKQFSIVEAKVAAAQGGIVHAHISSHAIQMDTKYPQVKGEGGIDEAIAPCDVCQTGRPLRDVELSILIHRMAQKGAHISLSFDCCHAGSVSRGEDDEDELSDDAAATKEAIIEKKAHEHPLSLPQNDTELLEVLKKLSNQQGQPYDLKLANCDFFASSCQDEKSYEEPQGDTYCGAYTHTLLSVLGKATEDKRTPTYGAIHDQIVATFRKERKQLQTPTFVGNRKRHFLRTTTHTTTMPSLPIIECLRNTFTLSGGHLQGVTQGSKYAIYPWDETNFDDILSRPAVSVEKVFADKSIARWNEETPQEKATSGLQAVLVKYKLTSVRFYLENPPATDKAATKRLEALHSLIKDDDGDGVAALHQGNGNDTKAYHIRVTSEHKYQLVDGSGKPIPQFPQSDKAAVFHSYLSHLGRYELVKKLWNPFPASWLLNCVNIEITGNNTTKSIADFCIRDGSPSDALTPIELAEGYYEITIRNKTDQSLKVTGFNFSPLWGVQIFYPFTYTENWATIGPRQLHKDKLRIDSLAELNWDPAIERIDYFKFFVADKTLSLDTFSSVEMKDVTDKVSYDGRGEDDLDNLLDGLGGDRGGSRGGRGVSKESPWITIILPIRTKPRISL